MYYADMIVLNVQRVAKRAGLKTAYQLQRLTGIHPATASYLWRGEAKNGDKKLPTLETLESLCEPLGCDLVELFTWTPDKPSGKRKGIK